TDKPYFGGSLDDLRAVRGAVDLPLLRKDFVFDPYQVYEAREAGADAVLLIAAVLSRGQIEDLASVAEDLCLDALVEVHALRELDQVLLAGGLLVGINNRDLATFETRLQTTLDLLADCPEEATVVSESGIKTRGDVTRLEEAGVDAVLVGETLMRAPDIGGKVKELLGESVKR
ncbi:MAG: indole-3-glycerol-phosphate synthase, partial [Nitrospirae bacterium]|nr:indole-3-glycerol-phosphate synthase [Nitrospirota bacterium]